LVTVIFYSDRQLWTKYLPSPLAIKLFMEKELFLFLIPRRWKGSRRASLTS
jgi:hypothetical protein